MKKYFVVAATFMLLLTSCGTSKRVAKDDYQYRKWLEEQAKEETQQRPSRTLRTTEPCIELAQADSDNLRAYGTATSYLEKNALNEAERDARNRLAMMLKTAVEGAAQDYEQNANKDLKNSAGSLSEAIMTQFVAEEITNSRVIKTTIYDLSDGSIQVYVCVEMKSDKDELEKNLGSKLDRDGFIELQYDRERFLKQMEKGLEEYKQKNMK